MSAEDFRAFSVQGVDGLIHLRCGFPHLADAFADEQEVLGIDVACLYEATGLLRTSAGVPSADQSGLVGDGVAPVLARKAQALAKAGGRDLQDRSGTGIADTEAGPEDE